MIEQKEVTKLWTAYRKAHEGKCPNCDFCGRVIDEPNCDVVVHQSGKIVFYHRRCRPHE